MVFLSSPPQGIFRQALHLDTIFDVGYIFPNRLGRGDHRATSQLTSAIHLPMYIRR